MDQPVVAQPAKKGRPRRPEMQPARIPPETLQQLDAFAKAINTVRPAGTLVVSKGRLAAEIIAKYGADYVATYVQDAQHRVQAALGAAQGAAVPQTHADALRLLLPDVPPLPEFAAPR